MGYRCIWFMYFTESNTGSETGSHWFMVKLVIIATFHESIILKNKRR